MRSGEASASPSPLSPQQEARTTSSAPCPAIPPTCVSVVHHLPASALIAQPMQRVADVLHSDIREGCGITLASNQGSDLHEGGARGGGSYRQGGSRMRATSGTGRAATQPPPLKRTRGAPAAHAAATWSGCRRTRAQLPPFSCGLSTCITLLFFACACHSR